MILARCRRCPDYIPKDWDELDLHLARHDFGGAEAPERHGEVLPGFVPPNTLGTEDGVAVAGALPPRPVAGLIVARRPSGGAGDLSAPSSVIPRCDYCREPATVRYLDTAYCSEHACSKLIIEKKTLPAVRWDLDHESRAS